MSVATTKNCGQPIDCASTPARGPTQTRPTDANALSSANCVAAKGPCDEDPGACFFETDQVNGFRFQLASGKCNRRQDVVRAVSQQRVELTAVRRAQPGEQRGAQLPTERRKILFERP